MLNNLLRIFKNTKNLDSTNHNYQLSIGYNTQKTDIDIIFGFPDLKNMKVEDIPSIAEQYAEFLIYTQTQAYRQQLYNLIKNHSKNIDNLKTKLFFDNLLSFYSLIKIEIQKKNSIKQPLIRPTAVFSHK